MKKILLLIAMIFSLPLWGGEEIALGKKDFKLGDFWWKLGKYSVTYEDGIFTVDIPVQHGISNETRGAIFNIPLKKLLGKGVQIRGEVRYENIAFDKGNAHAGGKILAYNEKAGLKNFFVSPTLKGTNNEWQPIMLTCEFPADIDDAQIVLGIQQGWGKLQFRNMRIEEFPIAPIIKADLPPNFRCEYTDRVTKNVARRGVMSPPWSRMTEQDIHDLAKWNVNLIRYQIVDGLVDAKNIEGYKKWFNSALDHIEKMMPLLEKYDIQVIIDMHHVVGGRCGKVSGFDPSHFMAMEDSKYLNAFVEIWRETAKRFKGNKQVYAFDLCNEPIQHGKAKHSFYEMQYAAAKAIREVDPEVPIMVEGNHMANPNFFEMEPIPLKNIIYSVHMYAPGDYTHQGVNDTSYTKQFYAKRYDYRKAGWNRERLAKSMEATRNFEKKYGAKIQVGEFSVAIWAPGGADYLNDLISIFEEYKWDWSYHAFREWTGWSLEHEGRPDAMWKAKQPTDRLKVMLKYWQKNNKK